jgi:PAS domain S-box-containing protein
MIAGASADDACHADVVRIVVLEEVLAARRVGYWRHQPRRRGDDLVMRTRAAGAHNGASADAAPFAGGVRGVAVVICVSISRLALSSRANRMQLPVRVKHGKSRQILANETGNRLLRSGQTLEGLLDPDLGERFERFFWVNLYRKRSPTRSALRAIIPAGPSPAVTTSIGAGSAMEVTLARKRAKSRTRGRKLHLTGAKARVGRARETRADLEQQLKACRREIADARERLAEMMKQRTATSEMLRSEQGLTVDIDEGRRAEEQHRLSAQLQTTLNVIPAYTWYAAPSGGLTFVNERTADYLGLPKDHPLRFGIDIGAPWDAHIPFLHPDDQEGARKAWPVNMSTGEASEFSFRVRNAQGGYRWFLSRVEPLRASDGTLLQWVGVNLDIEELKCTEQALRESEAKFRDYAETASDWFWEIGPDYKFTMLTENAFGSDPADRIGTACWDHALDLETEPEKWRLVRETLDARKPFRDFVYCSVGGNGLQIYVKASGKPVFDANGEFRGYRGTGSDVTERKRAEEALRESAEALQRSEFYLSEAQRLAHMGSWAFNPSGFFYHWSYELFQIYGMDPQKGAPTLEKYLAMVHPQDRDFMSETIKRMHAQCCGCDVKKRIIRPDGEVRYIRCVGIPVIEDEVLKGFLGTAMDITEQELLTQELERRQAYLAETQRLTHTGSWVWDPRNEKVLYCSEEMFRIFGLDRGSLPTRKRFRQRIHPDDREMVDERFERSLREKLDGFDEYRIILPDGALKYINSIGHPIFDDDGSLIAFVGTAVDVTERKRAQQEHDRLRELEANLAHMNRVSIMGELAASLAHEITQPIASARNNARAALNFLDRQPPDLGEVWEALGGVVGDADRAGDIIDRIRDHIKKAPPKKERFDLNEAINKVILLARTAIIKAGVSVQTRFADGLFAVQGDRVQVQQVVLNLILNAVEAMGSVEARARDLSISTEQDHTGVLVAVRDSGPGIDLAHLERVFQAFYTTKSSGVGMGLSICRSIIQAHGGRLWAEPNEPRGAVFQFTLPGA